MRALQWRRKYLRRLDRAFDTAHGVTTEGGLHLDQLGDFPSKLSGERYLPFHAAPFRRMLSLLRQPAETSIFIDIGAGKGRMVLVAADLPFRRVIGVEHAPELCVILESNIRRYRSGDQRCFALEACCLDAAAFSFPPEDSVIFMFNPLKAEALQHVLDNLAASYREKPRRITLLFVNPARKNRVAEIVDSVGIFRTRRCFDPLFNLLSSQRLLIGETFR